jgi:hypothetical protein
MLRYSSILRSNALRHREISYNALTPKPDAKNPAKMARRLAILPIGLSPIIENIRSAA